MSITLSHSNQTVKEEIHLTSSKSESNRALIIQALCDDTFEIDNLSISNDTVVLQELLGSDDSELSVNLAGTAMRFLTAYFSIKENKDVILTGSHRMKERPIGILVEALKQLGADISYLENDGFPPVKIKGGALVKDQVTINANVSSQYISALLLIASKLKNGIELTLIGEITSIPYINMTLDLLNQIGVETSFKDQVITVKPIEKVKPQQLMVESDWSSASYYYSIIALSKIGAKIELASYKENSLQGDSVLDEIYKSFGVETTFNNDTVQLEKVVAVNETVLNFNLMKSPDIAQTIAVTAFGLGLACNMMGLHTLKIKETNRLLALKTEIEKLGGEVLITQESLHLKVTEHVLPNVAIDTYHDHRMAMAFAPLAMVVPININEAEVVSKSYPTFWKDLKKIGFLIENQ